ncbi:MAG: hypothetical protein M3448_08515 [Pseudomonadota bacterium]|nr:hypothetical protein [Pseudomonadota bacterium]
METQERIERARTAVMALRDQWDAAERVAGPPCSECRHRLNLPKSPVCQHLAFRYFEHHPATGEKKLIGQRAITEARSDTGLCGPEALLFDEVGVDVHIARFIWRRRLEGAWLAMLSLFGWLIIYSSSSS